ncbi:MAG: hypothetical protein ACRDMX_04485 [Solirubrobacteraceae bacterium]
MRPGGALTGRVRTGVRFAGEAAGWPRFIERARERKPVTLGDCRSAPRAHLLPAFGERAIESITAEEVQRWRQSLTACRTAPRTSC